MWRARTQDDAGRPVRLRRFGVMPWRTARGRQSWLVRMLLTPTGLLTSAFIAVVGTIVTIAWTNGPWILWVVSITPVGASLMILGVMLAKSWNAVLVSRSERVKRGWLRAKLCPACGYSLEHLDADEQGLVTCPECGAAWLRDPTPPPRRVVIRDWAGPAEPPAEADGDVGSADGVPGRAASAEHAGDRTSAGAASAPRAGSSR